MKQHLWFIHGNLQQPTVWNPLTIELEKTYVIHRENLWNSKQTDFWSWAEHFCNKVAKYSSDTKHHLIGYSLGGRLGLHAILHNPELWQSAMIIASDTGLAKEEDRVKQLAWDEAWAKRFLSEDWDNLLTEWNRLSVFQGIENPNPPLEHEFSRQAITECFIKFSKGKQEDLMQELSNLNKPPICYVTGTKDKKYSDKGRALALACKIIEHIQIENAGHRVPWENVEGFKKVLGEHLKAHLD